MIALIHFVMFIGFLVFVLVTIFYLKRPIYSCIPKSSPEVLGLVQESISAGCSLRAPLYVTDEEWKELLKDWHSIVVKDYWSPRILNRGGAFIQRVIDR